MSAQLQRARILMEQGRYQDARRYLQQALAEDPQSSEVHALLGTCLQELGQHAKARAMAERAVALAPDHPYPHFFLGNILLHQDQPRKALECTREALRLDPEDPDYYAQLSGIYLRLHQFQESLDAAEAGLRIDAEHVGCVNLRAMALTHLGRKESASAGLAAALARDPEDATTHANQGWAALHAGDYPRAKEAFREALRLDPESDWAREGMIEAIKGSNLLYRPIHRFFLWTQRLGNAQLIAVALAFPITNRILRQVRESQPDLAPIIEPILYFLLFFLYLTWTAEALSDAVLLLSTHGRLIFSPARRLLAALCGAMMAVGTATLIAWFVSDEGRFLVFAILLLAMVIPLHSTASMPPGKGRIFLWVVTALLALLGAAVTIMPDLIVFFVLGIIGYTWLRFAAAAGHRAGI
jgi:tetratricopeptide (TPR) repeat protein